jgi:hypothetical protein
VGAGGRYERQGREGRKGRLGGGQQLRAPLH